MSELLLHIGHKKTGSSYLQNVFRLQRDLLRERFGINYPPHGDVEGGQAVRIGSGNGYRLLATPEAFRARLEFDATAGSHSTLYSSEFLFDELVDASDLGLFMAEARQFGFERVRLLLFTRDPISHAASSWQQEVKRGGETRSIEDAFQSYDIPELVDSLLSRVEALQDDRLQVTVFNYSRCRPRLLEVTTDWLGLPPASLPTLPVGSVNRSLTRSELTLQRALNERLGRRASVIADALCERLPDVAADNMLPSRDVQEAVWTRLLPAIDRVNQRLPEGHRYSMDVLEPSPTTDTIQFSTAQIDAIAAGVELAIDTLTNEVARIRTEPELELGGRTLVRALTRKVTDQLFKRRTSHN